MKQTQSFSCLHCTVQKGHERSMDLLWKNFLKGGKRKTGSKCSGTLQWIRGCFLWWTDLKAAFEATEQDGNQKWRTAWCVLREKLKGRKKFCTIHSLKILFGKQIPLNKSSCFERIVCMLLWRSSCFPLANLSSSEGWKESLLTNPYNSVHDLLLVLPELSDLSEFSGQ